METLTAVDYWNKYLEHNALRAPRSGKGPDTDAGAFLAWMLEAAGDMLRESSVLPPSGGYIAEKWLRINKHLWDNDWRLSLSEREQNDLDIITDQIKRLPARTDIEFKIKSLLINICSRYPSYVEESLKELKDTFAPMYKWNFNEPDNFKTFSENWRS